MSSVSYTAAQGVATITLNAPERRNPITGANMVDGIVDALATAERDRSVGAIILTGAGTAFSSGGDIRAMFDALPARQARPAETPDYYVDGIQRIPHAFAHLTVPTIAAVNGPAIGAGCDLACMCDIRIAARSARFAESFVRLGLIPGDGGAWFLQRVVGYARACEMTFTGMQVDADTALSWGLVSYVVDDADLLTTAKRLAGRFVANGPRSVRMAKRLITRGRETSMDTVLELSAGLQALAHTTPTHAEAVTRFIEGRSRPSGDGR